MTGEHRINIKVGSLVDIVLKKDQTTGKFTRGTVKRLLTKSAFHPQGIKVELERGEIGRVQVIIKE